jgi:hypothetical protein
MISCPGGRVRLRDPLLGGELRALRRLRREQEPKSPILFTSERGGPVAATAVKGWNQTFRSRTRDAYLLVAVFPSSIAISA